METLESILKDHPFFRGLEPHYLALVVGCAANVVFKEGQVLFREGEEANLFYVVRHGRIALELTSPERGALTVQTVGDGEILGWSWLIPPYHWHYTARAVEETRAITLDGKCLRGKCEEDHHLGYELLKRFAHIMEERLKATQVQLLDVYCPHPPEKKV
ncbi:MAG: cyclic nucleotide-binding domain-containing protein [Nitrospirota bacterium]|nr:cyclic nucleotide-binding domain-containing protein [Nitrospirota bacterium]